ncbi:hypothetical protein TIFTF001_018500 [Ficus carica]|uniref:Uncharacterized protein n=1 Tax=Ficus carica TaxID=3494 RepID=A0AA88AE38_FICCA|nr:hypothetical protein TIFTF001_018500 [Ficus carica]
MRIRSLCFVAKDDLPATSSNESHSRQSLWLSRQALVSHAGPLLPQLLRSTYLVVFLTGSTLRVLTNYAFTLLREQNSNGTANGRSCASCTKLSMSRCCCNKHFKCTLFLNSSFHEFLVRTSTLSSALHIDTTKAKIPSPRSGLGSAFEF